MQVSEEAIEYACKRTQDFAAVNQPLKWSEKLKAINTLFEGLGVDEDVREDLNDRLKSFIPESSYGPVLHGILIGLFIRQYEM